ncbi:MAG: acyltransferase family protein [Lachnospiraceae bacterium]|nr:acyltransferase family protein [Lachnospiraceae bacterium]MBR5994203.1 acyltransferase family protein [Lachnospiraceae bacterium]
MDTTKGIKRVDSVDILRAVGILIMVMGHVGFGGAFDRYIHSFHMPVFFLISGFLYVSKPEVGVGKRILKRAGRLLLPYVFYAVINYIFWLILECKDYSLWYEPLVKVVTYNTKDLPICGALWFLTAMFFAEAYYMLLDSAIKNSVVRSVTVIVVAVAASFLQNSTSFRLPLTIDIAVICMGFLELGRLCKKLDESSLIKKISGSRIILFAVGVVLLAGNAVLSFVNEYVNIKSGWYGFVPLFWVNALIGSAAYLAFSVWFDKSAKETNVIKKALVNIGRRSMIFLGLNQLVILLAVKGYGLLRLTLNAYIAGAIVLAISVIILYILCLLAETIKNEKFRKLLGI